MILQNRLYIIKPENAVMERQDQNKLTLGVKEKITLQASVLPENASDKSCKFTSSKPGAAAVSKKGRTFQIKVKLPGNTAGNRITYKSSNKDVASASASGKVKTLKKGKTTVTVTSFNN